MNKKIIIAVVIVVTLILLVLCGVIGYLGYQVYNLNAKINSVNDLAKITSVATDIPTVTTSMVTTTSAPTVTVVKWSIEDKTITEDTSKTAINVIYPELTNYPDKDVETKFNNIVSNLVNTEISNVKGAYSDIEKIKTTIDLNYSTYFESANYISIRIIGDEYLGGAHPAPFVVCVNYDLTENRIMSLGDVFKAGSGYLDTLSVQSKSILTSDYGADSLFPGGFSVNAANFKNFVFDENGIMVTFDYAQVGPGAMGTPEVTVVYMLFEDGAVKLSF